MTFALTRDYHHPSSWIELFRMALYRPSAAIYPFLTFFFPYCVPQKNEFAACINWAPYQKMWGVGMGFTEGNLSFSRASTPLFFLQRNLLAFPFSGQEFGSLWSTAGQWRSWSRWSGGFISWPGLSLSILRCLRTGDGKGTLEQRRSLFVVVVSLSLAVITTRWRSFSKPYIRPNLTCVRWDAWLLPESSLCHEFSKSLYVSSALSALPPRQQYGVNHTCLPYRVRMKTI